MHGLLTFTRQRRLVQMLAAGAVTLALVAGCGGAGGATATPAPPTDATAFATTQRSEKGLLQVRYEPEAQPVPLNTVHAWTLQVTSAEGQPVAGAQIAVSGDMPQHRHGLPTQPEVTADLGGGAYRVEGMKFQMPGWWAVTFEIRAQGEQDRVTFNLMLQ